MKPRAAELRRGGSGLRCAWFTHRYAPCIGGAEVYGRAVVSRLVRAGNSVDVFTADADDLRYFSRPGAGRLEAPSEEWIDGARVRRFRVRHFPGQRYIGRLLSYLPHWPTRCCRDSFLPWIPELNQVRGGYDVVFAVGFPFTNFPYGAYRTARACGAALVMTPFLHLATPDDPLRRVYTRPHQRRLLREADLVVSPTAFESEFLSGWGLPRERRLVLPLGIDRGGVTGGDTRKLRTTLGISESAYVVGQLGALHPDKGTCDLVRAVAAIAGTRTGIHLVLAGRESTELRSLVDELGAGASEWLHVLGPIDGADVPDFYASLDVFAMPSRTDSFGLVFLEAWANGLPVIAAASGGVAEVVDQRRTGLLVPFGDVGELRSVIEELRGNPELRTRLGERGRTRVERDGDWNARFGQLYDRVQDLLDRRAWGASQTPSSAATSRRPTGSASPRAAD